MQKKFVVAIRLVLIIPGVLFAMNFLKPRDYEQGYEQQEGEYISLAEEEVESILTLHIIDETDMEAALVPESPTEPVNYPPVNITKVSFGVSAH